MKFFAGLVFATLLLAESPAAADTEAAGARLTVELRDGSRVVGQNVEEKMKFHSSLLGDLKLPVAGIRSVEFTTTNAARLTATNGDTLMVQSGEKEIPVRTSFGKVELAVDSIRKISVAAGRPHGQNLPGLVALWSGENNGDDSINGNHAEWTDAAYADGKIGRAFSVSRFGTYGHVPPSPALDVGKGDGFTITVWIKPNDIHAWHPLVEWDDGHGLIGPHLWIGERPEDQGVLFANIVDDKQQRHALRTNPGVVVPGQFQLAALTYDKPSGEAVLYVDGKAACRENFGRFVPATGPDLWFSHRPGDRPGDWTYHAFYNGIMDEIAIYNRALSPAEIKSLAEQ